MEKIISLILAFFSISCLSAQLQSPKRGFLSTTIAKTWEEGLVSGNGTIGINVFGNPTDETIILTHERMFLPEHDPIVPPDQSEHLFEIRRLIDKGLYTEATQLQFKYSGQSSFMYHDPFVPVCDINIKMPAIGEVRNYRRALNFETGESTIFWKDDVCSYERNAFVSRSDSVAVIRIKASKPGSLNFDISFSRRKPSSYLSYNYLEGSYMVAAECIKDVKISANNGLMSYAHSFSKAYPGSVQSVDAIASIKVKGGSYNPTNAGYNVKNADEVTLYVSVEPNYSSKISNIEMMKHHLQSINDNYEQLLAKHAVIHGGLFNRVKLNLGGEEDQKLTTEELFKKSSNDNINKALIEKEFDAGRYNIISSTGELPPVLQGLWAGTFVPDWASDYTHNGNVPAAISSMLMGNTPELMLAYTRYIESLIPYLEINAKHMFGCRGIVLPSRTTTVGYNNALEGDFAGGFWLAGAAWASHFFYDYYLYTGDKTFLKEHALPFMEKAALFFEDFLYIGPDGKYIFSPTQSPENWPGNSLSQGTFNATMDVAATKELLNNIISASKILKVNSEKIKMWEEMLERMPDYMIDENGMFKEWLTPRLTNEDDHRHSSQFYALYDNFPEEFSQNTELLESVRRSINYKLERHWKGRSAGFMSFGIVQLGMVGASIGDKEIVHEALKHLVNEFWLPNMVSMHNYKSLLNVDISGGMIAVIIKMLAYSDLGLIRLLPALPEVWDKGSIEGILCRGQVKIEKMSWSPSSVEAILISPISQRIKIVCGVNVLNVNLKAGVPYTINMSR